MRGMWLDLRTLFGRRQPIRWSLFAGRARSSVALALTAGLAACGQTNQSGHHSTTSIQFVGNASCPTNGQQAYYAPKTPGVNSLPAVGQAVDEMPHVHVVPPARVTYIHNPPTSGCHYNLGYPDAPIQTGVYDKEVAPEYWVHNLEHGYVVVLYNCPSGCSTEFQQLRTWYHSLPADPGGAVPYPKVLILPWPTMDVPFAAVSWDWYDPIPVFNIDEVQRFYANHVGRGAEPSAP